MKTFSCIWKHLLIQKMQIFIYFSTSTSTKLGQTKAGICSPANTWEKVGISDQDMNPHISPSHPGGRQSRAHTPSSWRRWQTTTVFSSSPSTSSRWENWAFVCLLHQSCPSFPLAGFQATDADLLMPLAVYFYYWTSVFLPLANNCICCTNLLAFLDVLPSLRSITVAQNLRILGQISWKLWSKGIIKSN